MIIVSSCFEGLVICAHIQDESLVQAEREDRMTPYLVFLITAAALGGFLYGYDTGIIGVALPYVGDDLGHFLSDQEQEITTAACTIGSILGAAIIGYFSDAWGRKWCLAIADIL
jgi:SP family myo-inositol transporter-like MFS transporter 13